MSPSPRIQNDAEYHTYFLTITVIEWIDIFTKPEYFDILVNSLKFCIDNKDLILYEYVFMTNHIHLIARSHENGPGLSHIIRDFKSFTNKSIKDQLINDNRSYILRLLTKSFSKNNNNQIQIWRNNNFPEVLEERHHIEQKSNYIWQNPVKKNYVISAEDWKYSSARQRLNGKQSSLPLVCVDWEG